MLGFLAKIKLGNFLKRVGNGVVDSLPIVSTIKANIENNHNAEASGFGKLDWVRIIVNIGGVAIAFYITYNVIKGNISLAEAKELLNIVK